jgi:hypothetical protein
VSTLTSLYLAHGKDETKIMVTMSLIMTVKGHQQTLGPVDEDASDCLSYQIVLNSSVYSCHREG